MPDVKTQIINHYPNIHICLVSGFKLFVLPDTVETLLSILFRTDRHQVADGTFECYVFLHVFCDEALAGTGN